jgi:hypothetical protein
MTACIGRRAFITLLGGAAAAWPLAARAQQSQKLPTIGYLGPATPEAESQRVGALVQRLHELGWIEWGGAKIRGYGLEHRAYARKLSKKKPRLEAGLGMMMVVGTGFMAPTLSRPQASASSSHISWDRVRHSLQVRR